MNLGLDGACFLGDETGSDAMSEAMQHYHVFETAMGFCAIAWSDAGVARFQLPTKTAEAAERLMRRRAFWRGAGRAAGRRCGGRRGGEAVFCRRGNRLLAGSSSTSRARTRSLRRFMTPCAGSAGGARPPMARWRRRSAPAAKRRAMSARRWPEIRRLDHSLSPGAGRGRQNRRFLRARRLENEGPHARTGGRSP